MCVCVCVRACMRVCMCVCVSSMEWFCRLTLSEQLRTVRAEVAVKSEEVQRLKSELAAEKFQKYA